MKSFILALALFASTIGRRTFYNLSRQIGLRGPVDHTGHGFTIFCTDLLLCP